MAPHEEAKENSTTDHWAMRTLCFHRICHPKWAPSYLMTRCRWSASTQMQKALTCSISGATDWSLVASSHHRLRPMAHVQQMDERWLFPRERRFSCWWLSGAESQLVGFEEYDLHQGYYWVKKKKKRARDERENNWCHKNDRDPKLNTDGPVITFM